MFLTGKYINGKYTFGFTKKMSIKVGHNDIHPIPNTMEELVAHCVSHPTHFSQVTGESHLEEGDLGPTIQGIMQAIKEDPSSGMRLSQHHTHAHMYHPEDHDHDHEDLNPIIPDTLEF